MLIIPRPLPFHLPIFRRLLSAENCMATNQKCTTTSAEQSKNITQGQLIFSARFSWLAEERVEMFKKIIIWNYVIHWFLLLFRHTTSIFPLSFVNSQCRNSICRLAVQNLVYLYTYICICIYISIIMYLFVRPGELYLRIEIRTALPHRRAANARVKCRCREVC